MRDLQLTSISRRSMLAAGLASTAALALQTTTLVADTPQDSRYGPFKMGLQSYSLRHFKFDEALEKTKDLGLGYWESYNAHIPETTDPGKLQPLKDRASERGIKVIGYGVVHWSNNHDQNRRRFEFGKLLGLEYFSADPDPNAFDSLDRCVEEFGIGIGIHNHGPRHRYGKIDTIAAAIKDHHPKIGCCIDTGHFLRAREDPVRAAEVFHSRIYGVHLKDVKDHETFTILGKGDLKTVDLLKVLAQQKYSYALALEYEEHEAAPMDDIRACLEEVRRAVAKI